MFEEFMLDQVLGRLGPHPLWMVGSVAAALFLLVLGTGLRGRSTRRRGGPPVAAAILTTTPIRTAALLNRSEARVFYVIEDLLREFGTGHRLFAQVSVGQVLKVQAGGAAGSDRQSAFNMINAKRFDFVIVDRNWQPVAAVEYHGTGHNRGNAQARDAIKRIACQSAGLPLLEITSDGLNAKDLAALRGFLGNAAPFAAE